MVGYILTAICLCLSMLGLAEFLHAVKIRLLNIGKRGLMYSVIFLRPTLPERQIAFAAEQRLWLGGSFADTVIAVSDGLSAEGEAACKAAAEKYGIILCNAKELAEVLEAQFIAKNGEVAYTDGKFNRDSRAQRNG